MRSIWKGLISFGLVNIPVELYPAVEEKDLHFNQLHRSDGGRVGYDKICKICSQKLGAEEIVRAYEYEKGRYVTLTDEDFEKAARTASRAISIQQFVNESAIDPLYFEKGYYLGPDEAGKTAYALLLEALNRSKRVGIAKMVMRDKEYLALIRPANDVIVLNMMHFPDEIRKPEGIGLPSSDIKLGDRERDMADLLVQSMSGEFDPEQYQDTYRLELMEMIRAKSEGAEYQPEEAPLQPTNVIDIVARLKASIEQADEQKKKAVEPRKPAEEHKRKVKVA